MMKKILIILFVVASGIVSGQRVFSPSVDGVPGRNQPAGIIGLPLDGRSMYHDTTFYPAKWRDFQSVAEANTYFNTATKRAGRFLIYIHSGGLLSSGVWTGGIPVDYWYTGLDDSSLVVKTVGSTVAATPVAINYGYSITDPFVDLVSAPIYTNAGTTNIAYNSDISIPFPKLAADNYIVIRSPASEPIKTNGGFLPDQVWRIVVSGGYTYYISRKQYALNGAVKLF